MRRSPEEPWKDCAYTRATFRDKATALLLEVAKKRAAQEEGHINPMAAEQIRDKIYVDDGFAGGSEEDVTGDDAPGAADPWDGKVLGLEYKLAEDEFTFGINMKFNLRGRIRQKQMVELDAREVERIRLSQRIFTRREAFSFVAGNFDPLEHIIPMLLTECLLPQRLYVHLASTWDADLPAEEKDQWISDFKTGRRRLQSP